MVLVALNGFRGLWYIYVFRFLILFSSIIPIRYVSHLPLPFFRVMSVLCPLLFLLIVFGSVFMANILLKVSALTLTWEKRYMRNKLCRTARFQVQSSVQVLFQKNLEESNTC